MFPHKFILVPDTDFDVLRQYHFFFKKAFVYLERKVTLKCSKSKLTQNFF